MYSRALCIFIAHISLYVTAFTCVLTIKRAPIVAAVMFFCGDKGLHTHIMIKVRMKATETCVLSA